MNPPALSRDRPGADPARAARHPLVCAGLYRGPGHRLAGHAPACASSRPRCCRPPRSTTSCCGRRWASSWAAGWATCCSTSRASTSRTRCHPDPVGRRHVVPRRAFWASSSPPRLLAAQQDRSVPAVATWWPSCRRSACSSAGWPTSSTASCGAAPSDVAWAMVFPRGGPLPRHPSQLYQAFFEGIALFAVMMLVWRLTDGRHRPGLLTGVFFAGYGVARIAARCSASPTRISAICGGRITMGMLLSVPMLFFGAWLIARAYAPPCRVVTTRLTRARPADRPTHRAHRPDLARRLHGRGAGPSPARLLPHGAARRRRRRLHHRAGNLPDVRRAFGRLAGRALAGDGTPRAACGWSSSDRAAAP